jgi:hypothetical protein
MLEPCKLSLVRQIFGTRAKACKPIAARRRFRDIPWPELEPATFGFAKPVEPRSCGQPSFKVHLLPSIDSERSLFATEQTCAGYAA